MILAYDFPLLSIFMSVMWFFLWVVWIMTLFHVIGDIFRSRDLGGVAKTAWLLFVLFLPFLGIFAYLIARGDQMGVHAMEAHQAREAYTENYIRSVAGTNNVADQIAQLTQLRADGAIDDADFQAAKAKVLA